MNKEFIPYEQALALKELGFDEPCFCYWYTRQGSFPSIRTKDIQFNGWKNYPDSNTVAPLYQQAFRWFRQKYNIFGLVEGGYADGKNIFTYVIWNNFKDDYCDDYVSTYEEAELECLKKLIEVTKTK